MRSLRRIALVALAVLATATPAGAHASVPAHAAAKIVIHGRFVHMHGLTVTYQSARGSYTATWIGRQRYRLSGRIDGRRLTGRIRAHQAPGGTSYRVRGAGRLGGRAVRIGGGGPNNLSRSTLILR